MPNEVKKTQLYLTSRNEQGEFYEHFASARPFANLDTNSKIINNDIVLGLWSSKCIRTIFFKDSLTYIDSMFYRNNQTTRDDTTIQLILILTQNKIKIYEKNINNGNIKNILSRNYKILNGRYLIIYDFLNFNSTTNFIGMNQKGEIFINNYNSIMENYYGKYKIWKTFCTRLIFEKIQS